MRLRTLLHTSVLQLTLVYVALFGVSVLALFYLIYWSTLGYLERQTNATIQVEIDGLLEQYERRGASGLADVIAERVRRDDENRSVYLLADAHRAGRSPATCLICPSELDALTGQWLDFVEPQSGGASTPVRAGLIRVGPGLRLLVGRDIRELAQIRQLFAPRIDLWAHAHDGARDRGRRADGVQRAAPARGVEQDDAPDHCGRPEPPRAAARLGRRARRACRKHQRDARPDPEAHRGHAPRRRQRRSRLARTAHAPAQPARDARRR